MTAIQNLTETSTAATLIGQSKCSGAEDTLKTRGETESAIAEGIGRFELEYMGRGPKDVRVHLINDMIVVRMKGVLTAAEQHLVKTLPSDKGRQLLKQVRSHLIEIARPMLEALVEGITRIAIVSLHHDISTVTGEEIILFTLASSPKCRELKNQRDAR